MKFTRSGTGSLYAQNVSDRQTYTFCQCLRKPVFAQAAERTRFMKDRIIPNAFERQAKVVTARWCLVWFLAGMAAGLCIEAKGAEFYEGKPKAQSLVFDLSRDCPFYVAPIVEKWAKIATTFAYVEIEGTTGLKTARDGQSVIHCGTDWIQSSLVETEGYAVEHYGAGDAIAGQAALWWPGGVIDECDIQLDADLREILDEVTGHEMFHCLGLRHTLYPNSLMKATVRNGQGIGWDDITGLCELYACKDLIPDDYGHIYIPKISRLGEDEVYSGTIIAIELSVKRLD